MPSDDHRTVTCLLHGAFVAISCGLVAAVAFGPHTAATTAMLMSTAIAVTRDALDESADWMSARAPATLTGGALAAAALAIATRSMP